ETCDTGIARPMTGFCPTLADCNDSDACTIDSLTGSGCTVRCAHMAITMPSSTPDGCCPPGGNANNDADCRPVCGNGIVEPGEQCDDNNTVNGDGCSSTCQFEPRAFRVTELNVRDPHIFVSVPIFGCQDITDNVPLLGRGSSVNGRLNSSITSDTTPMDGFFDLSILALFNPLDQTGAATSPVNLYSQADCSTQGTMACIPHLGVAPSTGTITNHSSGQCLPILPGTTCAG